MAATTATLQGITLIENGAPRCVIVLGAQPSSAAQRAATELQTYLRKMSSAQVAIRSEQQLTDAERRNAALVLVGDSQLAAQNGVRSETLGLEGIRRKTVGRHLILLGNDKRPDGLPLNGTLWAIYEFLEKHLGVRWLFPGELGEVVPKRTTITVGAIDEQFTPALRQRKIRNIGYNERVQQGLDALGFSKDEFLKKHADAAPWFQRQRIGGSMNLNYGHAYGNWWERFGKEHPEWFALQPDGSRGQSAAPDRARLCKSNPQLIAKIAEEVSKTLEANPRLDSVSISPNDGGRNVFCMCENCKAWDVPEQEKVEFRSPKGDFLYPAISDRVVRFYNGIAEQVVQKHPDRYLGAYAYSVYAAPPLREKLHPNIIIGFVGFTYLNDEARARSRRHWDGWTKNAKRLFLRPNLLMDGMGFPVVYVHCLADDLRHCVQTGLLVTDFDCCYQHWSTNGLTYYVLAKLLWKPDADVDAIVDDYCKAGFDKAAEPVKRYFATLERLTDHVAREGKYAGRRELHTLAVYYTDDFLAECQRHLDEAKRLAKEDNVVLQRVALLEVGLRYAKVQRDVQLTLHALRSEETKDRAAHERALQAREAFYKELGISWGLNSAYLKFYGL